jgi:hypothetical protein
MHALVSRSLFDEQVKGLTPRLAESRDWVFHMVEYPVVELAFTAPQGSRPPLRLRLQCDNFNEQPPSVTLLDAAGGVLPCTNPPRREILPNPSNIFHAGPHPKFGRPFICMAGTLEYHTHPSHLTDHWDRYRSNDGYDIGGLLTRIWHGWLQGG